MWYIKAAWGKFEVWILVRDGLKTWLSYSMSKAINWNWNVINYVTRSFLTMKFKPNIDRKSILVCLSNQALIIVQSAVIH